MNNPGKDIRTKLPRTDQGQYTPSPQRPSLLASIRQSNEGRVKTLIPIRHGRMSASPFAFYRGSAGIMAQDLSYFPHTNMKVQAIGDCHLMNFGGFATPERTIIFDANDFDETLPAPWEWDLKRLATSFVLAGRYRQLKETDARDMAIAVAAAYRKGVQEFSTMRTLDLWYTKFDLHALTNTAIRPALKAEIAATDKESAQKMLYKIAQHDSGHYKIIDHPPLIYHSAALEKEKSNIRTFLEAYSRSLQEDRRHLFHKYQFVDIALKVVGVGSVGTRCMVALMMNDKNESLFLQIKEARRSVLEAFTAKSKYRHCGERVVQGQRLVQAASDIFLGWGYGLDGKDYYLRQLRDHKIAPDVEHFDKTLLLSYAGLCGRLLARAHAKTGPGESIAGYIGKSDAFDLAIGKFAVAYADQTEKDFDAFKKAIKAGKLPIEKA